MSGNVKKLNFLLLYQVKAIVYQWSSTRNYVLNHFTYTQWLVVCFKKCLLGISLLLSNYLYFHSVELLLSLRHWVWNCYGHINNFLILNSCTAWFSRYLLSSPLTKWRSSLLCQEVIALRYCIKWQTHRILTPSTLSYKAYGLHRVERKEREYILCIIKIWNELWRTILQEIVVGESLTENWREQAAFFCKHLGTLKL